jgi:hypothetical protein
MGLKRTQSPHDSFYRISTWQLNSLFDQLSLLSPKSWFSTSFRKCQTRFQNPKLRKRLLWNLGTKTKQNWQNTSTSTGYIQNSLQEELSLWSYESWKLKTPSTKMLFALSLSLSMTESNNITLLYTWQQKPRAGAEMSRQSIYLPTKRKTTKTKKKQEKNQQQQTRLPLCCWASRSDCTHAVYNSGPKTLDRENRILNPRS